MIKVDNVSKKYGKVVANKRICMDIEPGKISVLLGPNGAGKSTIIKCICGLLRFEGKITINDHDNHSIEAKKSLGYIPETPALYGMLTVHEHMEFIAKAYKLDNTWEEKSCKLLKRFELKDFQNKLGKDLSKGMQQKVSICCALLTDPDAVIFDEPFVGLDPHAIRELKNILLELKNEGCSILISTHMIDTMENNWDKTHIMMDGKIVETLIKNNMDHGITLEERFFEITEGSRVEE